MNKLGGETEQLEGLQAQALFLGASSTAILPASRLPIDDRFAKMCGSPTPCPSYGLAPGCPPHAMRPDAFKRLVQDYPWLLVFKIDAPISDLLSQRRLEIARNVHRIAATLERSALSRGMEKAKGMAAGSCKELFCDREHSCTVLADHHPCRYPNLARPSISAVGVDFGELAAMLDWPFGKLTADTSGNDKVMGLMAGLVLLA